MRLNSFGLVKRAGIRQESEQETNTGSDPTH